MSNVTLLLIGRNYWSEIRLSETDLSQSEFTCSKLTLETLEQGVKDVKSKH